MCQVVARKIKLYNNNKKKIAKKASKLQSYIRTKVIITKEIEEKRERERKKAKIY